MQFNSLPIKKKKKKKKSPCLSYHLDIYKGVRDLHFKTSCASCPPKNHVIQKSLLTDEESTQVTQKQKSSSLKTLVFHCGEASDLWILHAKAKKLHKLFGIWVVENQLITFFRLFNDFGVNAETI